MKEKEYKALVDREAFFTLKDAVQSACSAEPKVIRQCNHYFDTENFDLFQNGATLRIREIKGKLELQLKRPLRLEGNVKTSEEYHATVGSLPDCIQGGLPAGLDAAYQYLGTLCTVRTRFLFPKGIKIDFDCNTYFSTTDYEIEIEYAAEEPREWITIIGEKSIPGAPIGKYTRFVRKERKRVSNGT